MGEDSHDAGPPDERAQRLAKIDALRAAGVDPYPVRFDRDLTLGELRDRYGQLPADSGTGERVRVAGAKHFRLEVREANLAARRLYEKCGFRVEGRRRGYYRDPAEDAILYRRDMTIAPTAVQMRSLKKIVKSR